MLNHVRWGEGDSSISRIITVDIDRSLYSRLKTAAEAKRFTTKEYINRSLRLMLEKEEFLQSIAPYLSIDEYHGNRISLKDSKNRKLVDVFMSGRGLYCDTDKKTDCIHTWYVWALPELAHLSIKKQPDPDVPRAATTTRTTKKEETTYYNAATIDDDAADADPDPEADIPYQKLKEIYERLSDRIKTKSESNEDLRKALITFYSLIQPYQSETSKQEHRKQRRELLGSKLFDQPDNEKMKEFMSQWKNDLEKLRLSQLKLKANKRTAKL